MRRDVADFLDCPLCGGGHSSLDLHVFSQSQPNRVRDGVLVCKSCGAWFFIDDHLLELLPAQMMDIKAATGLLERHADAFAKTGAVRDAMGRMAAAPAVVADLSAQITQREHFDWYAEKVDGDYKDYAEMPFWRAVDEATLRRWAPILENVSWLLDIGCANGRSAFPMMKSGRMVVGFDISKAMVRQAIARAEREGHADKSTFFVCDGSRLPFRNDSFDCVQTYGVLHHLPVPEKVVREIQRALKPGGVHLGSENNETAFRGVFDFLMKLLPIWVEEAGEEPLLSRKKLLDWTQGLPIRIATATTVFLPPHLYNFLGARWLLAVTDGFATALPWVKKNGGLIVFEITKEKQGAKDSSGRHALT